MKFADLLQPAIALAENGFPVAEKIAEDWIPEVGKLKETPAAASTYLVNGGAPPPGTIFVQKNLAKSLRTLAQGGRDAFYKGPIAQAIVDYCKANGGFLSMQDFAEHTVRVGAAHLDDLQGLHAPRDAAEQPGADGAHPAEHSRGHRPRVDEERPGPLLPHADRGDEDRVLGS